jgi:hypothetical protein
VTEEEDKNDPRYDFHKRHLFIPFLGKYIEYILHEIRQGDSWLEEKAIQEFRGMLREEGNPFSSGGRAKRKD